jgi:hypothetical protein
MTAVMASLVPCRNGDGQLSEQAAEAISTLEKLSPMSHRVGLPIVVVMFVLALAVVASSSSAQTIIRSRQVASAGRGRRLRIKDEAALHSRRPALGIDAPTRIGVAATGLGN